MPPDVGAEFGCGCIPSRGFLAHRGQHDGVQVALEAAAKWLARHGLRRASGVFLEDGPLELVAVRSIA
jgi:hypothetical protein